MNKTEARIKTNEIIKQNAIFVGNAFKSISLKLNK